MDKKTLLKKLEQEAGHVELYYTDYNDSLQDPEHIYQYISEWYVDWIFELRDTRETIDNILSNIFDDKELEFIRNDEETKEAMEQYLYDNDKSDPLKDLTKNTNTRYRYDLDIEIPDLDYMNKSEYNKLIKSLTNKFKRFWYKEKDIRNMIGNSSYGWQLYMLWHWNLNDFENNQNKKYIDITGELICFNSGNGSGWWTEKQNTVTVQRDPEHLILDDLGWGYWYATDLCGLCPSYYEGDIHFENKVDTYIRITKQKSQAKIDEEKQNEYDKVYRAWWCSATDRNMSRHRNVEYRNHYPCGWKCKDCWRFWID